MAVPRRIRLPPARAARAGRPGRARRRAAADAAERPRGPRQPGRRHASARISSSTGRSRSGCAATSSCAAGTASVTAPATNQQFHPVLHGGDPQFLQPGRRSPGEAVGELLVRRPPPQRQRLVQHRHGRRGIGSESARSVGSPPRTARRRPRRSRPPARIPDPWSGWWLPAARGGPGAAGPPGAAHWWRRAGTSSPHTASTNRDAGTAALGWRSRATSKARRRVPGSVSRSVPTSTSSGPSTRNIIAGSLDVGRAESVTVARWGRGPRR